MEAFANIISLISGFLYSYILIALLIAAGLYFTIKKQALSSSACLENRFASSRKKGRTGNPFPSFQALMVSTASRVGTGNVVGVTGAIIAGGAGAVLWMWLIASSAVPPPLSNPPSHRFIRKRASMAPMAARPIISNRGLALRFWACLCRCPHPHLYGRL